LGASIQQADLGYKRKITQFEGVPKELGHTILGFAPINPSNSPLKLQFPRIGKSTILNA
jgi:hypothetical protein